MNRKPMATYKKDVPRETLNELMQGVLVVIGAFFMGITFLIGLAYLPEYLEWRDGEKHMNIYGIRG